MYMKSLFIIVFIAAALNLYSENSIPDSTEVKNFKFAATEVIGLNLGVWSVDHYIAQEEWANISISSVKKNLETGFVFDDSEFLMNQFLHPYHGNLYFNSARTNGFNFWESAPFAFCGSALWEMFMETEAPSNNDLITTTMGGIMLGEITWRVSSLLLDDSSTGSERVWRELAAGLVNPVRGINRLVTGRSKKHRKFNYDNQPVTAQISFGGNTVGEGLDINNGKEYPLLKMQFIYGSPFIKEERKPFDYFNLHLGLNLKGSNTITNFYGEALLMGKNIQFKGNTSDMVQDNLIGAFQHFDYLANDVYKIAANGAGGGIISRFSAYEGMDMFTSCHFSGIILGGSNSAYAEISGRDHNLGPGISTKFEAWLVNNKYGEMYLSYMNYWIYTVSGADGSESIEITNGRIETPINKKFKIGLEYLYYSREGLYDDFENIKAQNNELRSYISYRF